MIKKRLLSTILIMALILLFSMPMSAYACTPGTVTINKIVNGVENDITEFTFTVNSWDVVGWTEPVEKDDISFDLGTEGDELFDVLKKPKPKPEPIYGWKFYETVKASEISSGTFTYAGDMKFQIIESAHDGYTQVAPSSIETENINGNQSYTFTNAFIPIVIPTGTITVSKNVISSNGEDIKDNHEFSFTYILKEEVSLNSVATPYTFSEDSPKELILTYGIYVFTEIDVVDDVYTNITSGGSVTVEINSDSQTGVVLFNNEYKQPETPVIPDPPHHHHDTTTEPPIVVEPPVVEPPVVEPPIIDIPNEDIPEGPLPQTGGLDSLFLYGLGTLLTGGGLGLRFKK